MALSLAAPGADLRIRQLVAPGGRRSQPPAKTIHCRPYRRNRDLKLGAALRHPASVMKRALENRSLDRGVALLEALSIHVGSGLQDLHAITPLHMIELTNAVG